MPTLLRLREAAQVTGVSVRVLREAIARRDLAYTRFNHRGRLYLAEADIREWLAHARQHRGGSLVHELVDAPRPIEALMPAERRFS